MRWSSVRWHCQTASPRRGCHCRCRSSAAAMTRRPPCASAKPTKRTPTGTSAARRALPNPMVKPVLLVTRRLPPAVEARAIRDYDARLNPEDVPRSGADIVRLADGGAAILCCPAERLDAATIMALPDTVRVIATYR